MAAGYLHLALLLAVTTSLTTSQGNNSIQAGIQVLHKVARVIAQKSSPLLLNCSVVVDSDVGAVQYQWQKNGNPLNVGKLDSNRLQVFQNGSLYIKRVVHKTGRRRKRPRSDQGVYECVIRTRYGQAIVRRVTVQIASISRKFRQDPVPFRAYEGGVARFQCSITAVPPPIILWQKEQHNLQEANPSKYVQLPQGVLHVRDVTQEDAGSYRCVAWHGGLHNLPDVVDTIDWQDSQSATLSVVPAPTQQAMRVLAAPKNLTLELRGSGVMECLADGVPPPAVTWSRPGGKSIAANHVVEPGLLRLMDVSESDAGDYICTVAKLGISLTATLYINKPPVLVEKSPSSQQWAMMRTVRFACDVTGTPKPQITWFRNGEKITEGMPKITIKAKQLIIRHTAENDSGYYQCIAENSAGNLILLARLNVYRKEGMPETPQNLTGHAVSSTSINLQWYQPQQPNGEPIITNTIWFARDASSLRSQFVNEAGPTFNFTLTGLEPFTNYTVYIRSFNRVGASASSQSVTVQTLEEVPRAAPRVKLTSPAPDTLRVSWEPLKREDSQGKVVSYRVYYRQMPHGPEILEAEVPASQHKYQLTGLEPETEYGVRVLAATSVGYAKLKPEAIEWTILKTDNKLGSVKQLLVEPINQTTVRILWQPGMGEADVAMYSAELFSHVQGQTTSLRTLQVAAPRTDIILSRLDNTTQYQVSIVAISGQFRSKPAKVDFQTSALLPPVALRAEHLTPSTLLVAWQQPAGMLASTYSVCYLAQRRATPPDSAHWTCFESRSLNATVRNLQPFTKYLFSISAHAGDLRSPPSDYLGIQTLEDVPSPPEDISWNPVSPGTIELNWEPPTSPNGVITSYIILYNPDQRTPETTWKNITQTGQITRAQVGDLTATLYYFKLRACTRAGKGSPSPVVVVKPECPSAKHPCHHPDNKASLYGLVFGVVVGLALIVACLITTRYCIRRRRAYSENEAPHFHGNGHAAGARGPNGHTRNVEVGSRLAIALQDFDSLAPMLTKLPENEQSDSKGGGNMIVTPNGVKVNGLLKCYQNGQLPNGHLTHYPVSLPPYCESHEETHRLIDLMLASTDGSLTGEGSDCAGASSILTTEHDSLEDIEHSHDENCDDCDSSAGGSREEGMVKVEAESERDGDGGPRRRENVQSPSSTPSTPTLSPNGPCRMGGLAPASPSTPRGPLHGPGSVQTTPSRGMPKENTLVKESMRPEGSGVCSERGNREAGRGVKLENRNPDSAPCGGTSTGTGEDESEGRAESRMTEQGEACRNQTLAESARGTVQETIPQAKIKNGSECSSASSERAAEV